MKLKDLNQEIQLLALDILDYIMSEGKAPTWTQISSKNFLTNLISLLKTRDAPEVQVKILYLIKKWGVRFESQKEILPNFSEVYNSLKNSGVVFPEDIEPDFYKYIGSSDDYSNVSPNVSSHQIVQNQSNSNNNSRKNTNNVNNNVYQNEFINEDIQPNYNKNVNLDLNPDNYEKKYKKFVTELSVLIDNINLANEMIDNTQVGSPVDEGLRTIVQNLRELEGNLVLAIQDKIKNEKLLGICLGINDDINRTFARYDLLKMKKNPGPFISAFEEEYASSNTMNSKEKKNVKESKEKPFDFFAVDDTSTQNVNQPKKIESVPAQSVNDIFDIFNPNNNVSVNKPQVDNNNISKDMGNMNLGGNTNMSNPNVNPHVNPNVNPNVNVNKSQADILAEKLKSIYDGGDNNLNASPNTNMNNMNMMVILIFLLFRVVDIQ